ncbi:hypothetical protein FNV43_RR06506 [Rhamnella rubrinervis]|uniref:Uncharacterized protein n=1 Tax=Rhamnella rubrinervis TaxID=2594499 RepID=A0A8K0MM17_9ROSA|nr:hypothetical protein FNV43_RR06506 [Rhamnella rubrinervis]
MGTVNPNNTPETILNLVMLTVLLLCLAIKIEAQTAARTVPRYEIEALKEIAAELGKKDCNFGKDPCRWNNETSPDAKDSVYNNTVNCNCNFTGGVCHVQNIYLEGQDLSGVLPPSLAKLPYIKQVDFTRNYLSGTIPDQWVSTKLENFSLNANNLTGELPKELANLTQLEIFKINSNNFTGKIPDFIKNWKSLKRLEIQASGFEGPVPSTTIFMLKNLNELIVSDLNNGDGSKFPPLKDMDLHRLSNKYSETGKTVLDEQPAQRECSNWNIEKIA